MRVVLFGAPGSGKGTQARLIVEKFGIAHICSSELLRDAIAEGSPIGLQVKTAIDQNNLIPDDVILTLVRDRLTKPDASKGFVLDGVPSNLIQSQALDQLLDIVGRPLDVAIFLDTDFDALMQRITGRLLCRPCGNVYNIFTDPPAMDGQCDECGGNLRHRADDNEEIITNRYRQYETVTLPAIEYYREQGKVRAVQGIGEVNDIFAAVSNILGEIEVTVSDVPMPTVEQLEQLVMKKALETQIQGTKPAQESAAEIKSKVKEAPVKKKVTEKKISKKTPVTKKPVAKKKVTSKSVLKKKVASKKKTTAKKKAPVKKSPAKKKGVKKTAVKKKVTVKKVAVKKKITTKKKIQVKKAASKKKLATKSTIKKVTRKKAIKKK